MGVSKKYQKQNSVWWRLNRTNVFLFVFTVCVSPIFAQNVEKIRLSDAIQTIQEQGTWSFLYKDALISGSYVPTSVIEPFQIPAFVSELLLQRIEVIVDSTRHHIYLVRMKKEEVTQIFLRGQILDDTDGFSLPHANVFWKEKGVLKGVVGDENGRFSLEIGSDIRELTVSFVGYEEIVFQPPNVSTPITLRLKRTSLEAGSVVVVDSRGRAFADTSGASFYYLPLRSVSGEGNAILSLDIFPSVTTNVGISKGMNVRGSNPDGLQVLLDGNFIFNQNHLFGLFDVFNREALHTSGFHYGFTPAQYQGFSGATVDFSTKSGSRTGFGGSVRSSTIASDFSLEGPIQNGKGSYFISARHSLINAIPGLGNSELVSFGLNVERPKSPLPDSVILNRLQPLSERNVDAQFYDIHFRGSYDLAERVTVNFGLYSGLDEASESASRLTRNPENMELLNESVNTENFWAMNTGFLRADIVLENGAVWKLNTGFSQFETRFSKDDYIYSTPGNTQGSPNQNFGLFGNKTNFSQISLSAHYLKTLPDQQSIISGLDIYRYENTYVEQSQFRNNVTTDRQKFDFSPTQMDGFVQWDSSPSTDFTYNFGLRAQYYSLGNYVFLSPRANIRYAFSPKLSAFSTYSRYNQFLHRLSVDRITIADIWIMSDNEKGPSVSDEFSAGITWRPFPQTQLTVEGYNKLTKRQRLYQINNVLFIDRFVNDDRFAENTNHSRGIETSLVHTFAPFKVAMFYTWSKTDLQNDAVNGGNPVLADWDRRHQLNTLFDAKMNTWLSGWVLMNVSSGSPNNLARVQAQNVSQNAQLLAAEVSTLPTYFRIDVGFTAITKGQRQNMSVDISFFNVLNRKNVWYREISQEFIRTTNRQTRSALFVRDVYDLGFRPNVSVKLDF